MRPRPTTVNAATPDAAEQPPSAAPKDRYDARARLAPAGIAAAPLVLVAVALGFVDLDATKAVGGVLVSLGILAFFGAIARIAGKQAEQVLLRDWGGFPTTIALRWSTDPTRAKRLHGDVERATGRRLPSAAEEALDPEAADTTYVAAVDDVIVSTRGPKRPELLTSAVESYGLWRNLYGLKPFALGAAGLALLAVVVVAAGTDDGQLRLLALVVGVVVLIDGILLVRFVRADAVRVIADAYARELFLAIAGQIDDEPPTSEPTSPPGDDGGSQQHEEEEQGSPPPGGAVPAEAHQQKEQSQLPPSISVAPSISPPMFDAGIRPGIAYLDSSFVDGDGAPEVAFLDDDEGGAPEAEHLDSDADGSADVVDEPQLDSHGDDDAIASSEDVPANGGGQAEPTSATPPGDSGPPRFVQAAVFATGGEQLRSVVRGAPNRLTIWIGQPERQAASENRSFPNAGRTMELAVLLDFASSTSSASMVVPASPTARSNDAEFVLDVPADMDTFHAEARFLERGKFIWEVELGGATTEAPVPIGDGDTELQVTSVVQTQAPGALADGPVYDAAFEVSAGTVRVLDPADPEAEPVSFPGMAPVVEKMGKALLQLQKDRARTSAASGMQGSGREDPDAGLRAVAQYGAALRDGYFGTTSDGIGDRVQVVNKDPSDLLPIEVFYDRASPHPEAKRCTGWDAALQSGSCAGCVASDDGSAICPMGWWSLRRSIERIEKPPRIKIPGLQQEPTTTGGTLDPLGVTAVAGSELVTSGDMATLCTRLTSVGLAPLPIPTSWNGWRSTVSTHLPPLLVLLPHQDTSDLEALEISSDGSLRRGAVSANEVRPPNGMPGPVVLLLGCNTAASPNDASYSFARDFCAKRGAVVVGTLSEVLANVASELAAAVIETIVEVSSSEPDVGDVMREVRRRLVARGHYFAIGLVSFGNADWKFALRGSG